MLEPGSEQPLVPSKAPTCVRCEDLDEEATKCWRTAPSLPPSLTQAHVEETKAAAGVPLRARPAFAYGPLGQELWAGWAGWSKGLEYQGIPTREPVELYADPLRLEGRRPQHDLGNEEIKTSLLSLASEAPGPGVPNIWQMVCSCRSFCDWMLENNGTRTFANPEGSGKLESEVEGNQFAEFAGA